MREKHTETFSDMKQLVDVGIASEEWFAGQ